ncbi:MAG: hypothetical protein QOG09_1819 [Solirubrobacterales bacterium]|nr:hypothetical protein [Solirubrobacterales bacterium]
MSSGYSGTPLAKKLGIKEASTVALVDAPEDFERTLGELPPAVELRAGARGKRDLIIWFVTSHRRLEQRWDSITRAIDAGLWIAWPKRASGVETDITEDVIREVALPRGWVDHKVCAIDETWSGLRLARRKVQS